MPQHHVSNPRGADLAPHSVLIQGRFGRMFRNLPGFEPDGPPPDLDAPLKVVAEAMLEPSEEIPSAESWSVQPVPELDSDIPAGYTYLGQFIDHDITFDPVSSLQRQNDPDALHNFRTPRFDLDSLYGAGPNNDPFMYDPDDPAKLLVGSNGQGDLDLPRNTLAVGSDGNPRGRALIGDPRNDENIIVSQLHLLFMRFHNLVVDRVRAEQPNLGSDALFEAAQRVVRCHYQWIVIHDFLERVVGQETVNDVLQQNGGTYAAPPAGAEVTYPRFNLRFYHWQQQPFMPVEFSVAAYRFGHSMIRPFYKINDTVPVLPIFSTSPTPGPLDAFHGFRPLPSQWKVDWAFFFESDDQSNMQVARKIDSKLALGTFHLTGESDVLRNLAFRNLRRGKRMGLPSGQRVARAMGIEPLSDDQLGLAGSDPLFTGNAPLWFYVLKEAELIGDGRLGPAGGRIVAEVLLGLLRGDPLSFVNVEPTWNPSRGGLVDSTTFTMQDLVRLVEPE